MNKTIVQLIATGLVTEAVIKNLSFTAYDITRETREIVGKTVDVPHDEIRGIVRVLFASGVMKNYTATPDYTIDGEPLRYASPTSVKQAVAKPAVQDKNNTIMQAFNAGVQGATGNSGDYKVKVDVKINPKPVAATPLKANDGKVRLLKDLVEKAGFDTGDTVVAYSTPGFKTITISRNAPRTNMNLNKTQYTVDSKKNIRINLSKLGVGKFSNFNATIADKEKGVIVIEAR